MCDLVAEKSKDPSTKVGAVIVGKNNEVVSTGFNGFPRGFKDKDVPERYERPLKYDLTEHAERNAIYNAARIGSRLDECKIYVNSLPPCTDCARGIIQSGIKEVVIVDKDIPERWRNNCAEAINMLEECGVNIRKIKHTSTNNDCVHDVWEIESLNSYKDPCTIGTQNMVTMVCKKCGKKNVLYHNS